MSPSEAPAPIDPRGPRTNQTVLSVALLVALATGQEWVAPLFAVVLFLGAAFGPRYGPVLRFYQVAITPRLAPPRMLEDPRPPRFAAAVGVAFLGAATVAFLFGSSSVGWVLVAAVALLAGLSAVTGLCVGCEVYVGLVRIRGGLRGFAMERARPGASPTPTSPTPTASPASSVMPLPEPVDRGALPALPPELRSVDARWVVFTTEYGATCPTVVAELRQRRPGEPVVVLDVAEHYDLAARYRVRRAPTVLRADAGGSVVARLAGVDAVWAELTSLTPAEV